MSQQSPATSVQPARAGRVPVTVALVERLPHGEGPFEIIRRAGSFPHDVILLARNAAGEEELSEAIRTLLAARHHAGDLPPRDAAFRVRPRNVQSREPMRSFPWAARVLRDVQGVAPQPLPGVGNVAFVQIWLPKQRSESR